MSLLGAILIQALNLYMAIEIGLVVADLLSSFLQRIGSQQQNFVALIQLITITYEKNTVKTQQNGRHN